MSSFAEDIIAILQGFEQRLIDLERAPRNFIRDAALTIVDADDNPIVVLGKQSDGLYNLSVFDDSGVRQSRVGQLSGGGYGIEDINGAGDTVTLEQLAFGLVAATVATNEAVSGGSYTDPATPGPAVTVNIGSSGRALVLLSTRIGSLSVATGQIDQARMSFAVSGATTLAPDDSRCALATLGLSSGATGTAQWSGSLSRAFVLDGLNPGSNTFTAKYATNDVAVSVNFVNRLIAVWPF